MAAAIRLEDLLKAQAKLKEDEAKKQTTETMSVEEFRKMASEMSDTTPGTTTKSLIKKGLTDKTGEGLNANVIKLTKVIKDTTAKKGNIAGPAGGAIAAPADRTAQTTRDVDEARRARLEDQAGKYQKGGIGFLKEKLNIPVNLKGLDALKAGVKGVGKMLSLENIIDTSEGKSEGWLGQVARRKIAKNQFVDRRMAEEVAAGRQKDTRANRKAFKNKFESLQTASAEAVEIKKERERYQAMLDSGVDKDAASKIRKKMAALDERSKPIDEQMAKADLAYRTRKKADEAVPIESTQVSKDSLEKATQNAEKGRIDETEAETARAASEQTTTLKQIEENTRSLKDLPNQLAKLAVPAAAAGAAAEESGFSLGDVGGGLKRAAKSVMKGARGLGSAMVRNPKMMGRLGAGLAIAGGAYTAYQGWNEAEDKKQEGLAQVDQAVAEGKVTPVEASTIKAKVTDDANAAKGAASGEGTGMAVGGIAGMKIGATIGTMVGGPVGTIVGGAVGGAAGAIAGSSVGKAVGGSIVRGYQSVRNFFGGKASVDETKPVEKASVTREYEVSGVTSDDIRNHPNYQNYYEKALNGRTGPDAERMARKSAAMKVTADIAKARAEQPTQAAATATPTAAVAPKAADQVYQQSGDNAQAARKGPELGAAPVIVNAPTNVQNNTQAAPRPPARNTESSWQQYNRSKYAMA